MDKYHLKDSAHKDLASARFSEIVKLLEKSKNHWTNTAKLLIEARQDKVYINQDPVHPNFTAWILDISQKAGIKDSNLWRALGSAEFLMKVKGYNSVDQIIGSKATPESIEIIRKIADDNLEVARDLIEQAEKKQITRDQLREKWSAVRKTRELQKNKSPNSFNDASFREYCIDAIKRHPRLKAENGISDFAIESVGLRGSIIIDYLTANVKNNKLQYAGFEFVLSKNQKAIEKWNNYARHCHYFYLVTTHASQESVMSSLIDRRTGIIVIDKNNDALVMQDPEFNDVPDHVKNVITEQFLLGTLSNTAK